MSFFSAFCIVDADKMCMAVTVYNLAKGRGVTVGDSVAIPEPYVIHQKFSYLNNVGNKCTYHFEIKVNDNHVNVCSFRTLILNLHVLKLQLYWLLMEEN